jgi:hypothetical protein
VKRAVFIVTILVLCLICGTAIAGPKKDGTTLQEGVIKYSAGHYLVGQAIPVGFDAYGYNYQAHLFKGDYANIYLGGYGFPAYGGDDAAYLAALTPAQRTAVQRVWCWPYRGISVEMKWNDAWISNMDRDGDGKLDRHYGFASYVGSDAWETNHMTWTGDNGSTAVDFVKIVAAPAGAKLVSGTWDAADGSELGPDIWGEFIVLQEIYNDAAYGYHGVLSKAPAPPGFGVYK